MATLQGTISGTGQEVSIIVPTIRIPELPQVELPYDANDKLAVYDSSQDKTVWTSISDFITYINSGAQAPEAPVIKGGKVEIVISAAQAGSNRVNNLPLAGKTFALERRGSGILLTSEYMILPSGGFELTDANDTVEEGEVFIAHVYEYQVDAPIPGQSGSAFLNGIAVVQSSTALDSTYFNKLIHVAGGNNRVTITLPDVLDCIGLTFPFETMINNNHQTKLVCKAGQVIYFANSSQSELFLGISEYVWLMAGNDGWYVMKASEALMQVGQPLMDFVIRLNTLPAYGQLVNRSDYPRLWKMLQGNPDLIVSDTVWGAKTHTIGTGQYVEEFFANKSKFSEGDGSTTFRIPDHRDLSFVGLKSGYDPDRSPNTPGTGQPDSIRSHAHNLMHGRVGGIDSNPGGGGWGANNNNPIEEGGLVKPYGSRKTVGKNVGLIPLIKV